MAWVNFVVYVLVGMVFVLGATIRLSGARRQNGEVEAEYVTVPLTDRP